MTMTETTATHEDVTTQTTEDALTALEAERERLARKRALLGQQYRDAAGRLDVAAMVAVRGQLAEATILLEETSMACAIGGARQHAEQAQARADAAHATWSGRHAEAERLHGEIAAAQERVRTMPNGDPTGADKIRALHAVQQQSTVLPGQIVDAHRAYTAAQGAADEAQRAYSAQVATLTQQVLGA